MILALAGSIATRVGGAVSSLLMTFLLARMLAPDDVGRFFTCANLMLGLSLLGKSEGDAFDGVRVERVVYQPEHSLRTNLVVRRPGG